MVVHFLLKPPLQPNLHPRRYPIIAVVAYIPAAKRVIMRVDIIISIIHLNKNHPKNTAQVQSYQHLIQKKVLNQML